MTRTCFLNVGIGQWYSKGSDRLAASLIAQGFKGDHLIWKDQWPGAIAGLDRSAIYNVKADAFQHALNAGYTTIIWGDSSMQALRPLDALLSHINTHGYWIGQSGYNCAQTASDAQLQYFGVSRDWAENVHDCATGLFGVNVEVPLMRSVIEQWIQAAKDGAFKGSRLHGGQSGDPRFLHCRQDQSAMSLILGKAGLPLKTFRDFARYRWDSYEAMFHCEGM